MQLRQFMDMIIIQQAMATHEFPNKSTFPYL